MSVRMVNARPSDTCRKSPRGLGVTQLVVEGIYVDKVCARNVPCKQVRAHAAAVDEGHVRHHAVIRGVIQVSVGNEIAQVRLVRAYRPGVAVGFIGEQVYLAAADHRSRLRFDFGSFFVDHRLRLRIAAESDLFHVAGVIGVARLAQKRGLVAVRAGVYGSRFRDDDDLPHTGKLRACLRDNDIVAVAILHDLHVLLV